MRKMTDGNTVLIVVEHIILKNFWEYYVTSDQFSEDIRVCLVMGAETELGDVSMEEIKPYVVSKTKDLNEIAPASGWNWIEEKNNG